MTQYLYARYRRIGIIGAVAVIAHTGGLKADSDESQVILDNTEV